MKNYLEYFNYNWQCENVYTNAWKLKWKLYLTVWYLYRPESIDFIETPSQPYISYLLTIIIIYK